MKKETNKRTHKRVQLHCNDEPRTKQSFKDQCDINKIVARFTKDNGVDLSYAKGFPPNGNYGDFSDIGDLRTMYERIAIAEESFLQLPAKIRKKFNNQPINFMEFASNEENLEEMYELGLATRPVNTDPVTPTVDNTSTVEKRQEK